MTPSLQILLRVYVRQRYRNVSKFREQNPFINLQNYLGKYLVWRYCFLRTTYLITNVVHLSLGKSAETIKKTNFVGLSIARILIYDPGRGSISAACG